MKMASEETMKRDRARECIRSPKLEREPLYWYSRHDEADNAMIEAVCGPSPTSQAFCTMLLHSASKQSWCESAICDRAADDTRSAFRRSGKGHDLVQQ